MRTSNIHTDEGLLEYILTLQPRPRVQNLHNECLNYVCFILHFSSGYTANLLQVDFILTISATWLKTARSVQMVHLLPMTKHQEHERKIASLVPMVYNIFFVIIYCRRALVVFVYVRERSFNFIED